MPAEVSPRAAAPPRRLFYWCHTTARQPFETGIQRVTRRLAHALGRIGFDIVPLGRHECSGLIEIIGRGAAAFETMLAGSGDHPILFIPELPADLVGRGVGPASMANAYGMRTLALVHDLIPLKLSQHYSATDLAMFVAYYESFSRIDAVLATTQGVAGELRRFLEDRALRVPPIMVVPLPAQFGDHPRVMETAVTRRAGEPLRLVTVASWERRKNLLRLLRAVQRAQRDAAIVLTLVGRRGLDAAYDAEVEAQLATAQGVFAQGALPDGGLVQLVAASHATVYPSWEEGFGLPVVESLWLGRPCLCHDASSLAEIAPGGGTMMIDMLDEDAIAAALVALATRPPLLARLAEEAVRRPLASWHDYANATAAWLAMGAAASPTAPMRIARPS